MSQFFSKSYYLASKLIFLMGMIRTVMLKSQTFKKLLFLTMIYTILFCVVTGNKIT